jgi:hypothetical protein
MVSGTIGNDMRLDRKSYQSKISNHIQEFVTGRFIGDPQFQVVQVSFAFYFNLVFFDF